MKICLVGGSGFIGTHLLELLLSAHDVTIIDKAPSKAYPERVIKGDIRDQEFLDRSLSGFDLVIHLAAEHADNVSPISLYYEVNVDGTRNLLNAMDRNGIRHLIFTSTVALYGLNKNNPDEQHPIAPFNDYGKSKWEAEQLIQKWVQVDGDRSASIVRPTVVFGENNRGNVYNLLNQIASGRFLMIGRGENKKSMAYVKNVAHFIEYLIDNGNGHQVFNYADKPDMSTQELITVIEHSLTKKVPPIRIPYLVGIMAGYFFDGLAKVSGMKLPLSSVRVKKFCATTQYDAIKAHSTRFKAPYSLHAGLRDTIEKEFGSARSNK